MSAASPIRLQIESALAARIPSALSPALRIVRPVASTGIAALDEVLRGGLPVGALTELIGPECSGRTSVALKFVASLTQAGRVCAWIDVSNALDPASAAAARVDLERLLWVRCGAAQPAPQYKQQRFSLPENEALGQSFSRKTPQGPHEVSGHDFSRADQPNKMNGALAPEGRSFGALSSHLRRKHSGIWAQLDQALRVTDLVLQAGGFSAVVLDLGSLAPEFASRVPLATWFRYRAAAEKTQACILLLAQYGCAKSSAELSLRLEPGDALRDEATVFTGMAHSVEVVRRRFTGAQENVVPLRKPPQKANAASWQSCASWAGVR
jgi:hypothetical protein